MKITVFGAGYVGLVTGICFASINNKVICVDVNKDKIKKLNKGIIPIFEPGLDDLLKKYRKNLTFTTDANAAIRDSEIIFIAVGTPQSETGEANLSFVYEVAETIGKNLDSYKVIVDKSTVPVGTGHIVRKVIEKNKKDKKISFGIISNPEFLREGSAITDFLSPDRIVVGYDDEKSRKIMQELYSPLNSTILFCDVKSAEMIKYASNAFLSTKISFINEVANICEFLGADVEMVKKGMGLDKRIGEKFLNPGIGFGGSCFPKDMEALYTTAMDNSKNPYIFQMLNTASQVNRRQKRILIPKIKSLLGEDLTGKKIAVWGLSFKPNTDDVREAPAIDIVRILMNDNANVVAYDPIAMENFKRFVSSKVEYSKDMYSMLKDADALVIITEWDEFRKCDLQKVKKLMKSLNIIDGRNIFSLEDMKKLGFNYICVGRPEVRLKTS